MAMSPLPAIVHETGPEPNASVIWLHGLGASGDDFAGIVPELQLPGELAIRFIFPHAPSIAVTVNNGFVMPAWYDVYSLDIDRKVDLDGLSASADAVNALIEQELQRGVESRRIILAGFSQGGAVAYQAALSHPRALGGLLAMSSYFASAATIRYHPANRELPIAIHHGVHDPVVPEALGRAARDLLREQGREVAYHTYAMEHNVCLEEITDISVWMQQIFKG